MEKFSRNLWIFLPLFLVFTVLNCSKDSIEPQPTPPALPPESTFLMDFTDFSGKDYGNLPKAGNTLMQTYDNWGWAVTNVAVWNTILTINLLVPVAAFKAAFLHDPVQQDDGSWIWTYPFNVLNVNYTAELHSIVTADSTHWDMFISKEQGFQRFLWYTGGSDTPFTHGSWLLYKHPAEPVPYLQIEWSRNPQDNTGDIIYTHVEGGDQPTAGSYIHYGHTTDFPYDCFYYIQMMPSGNKVDIEWNLQSKEGHIRDPLHFENSDWHCWNELLEDTECP